jgi:chromosomal replication initiator protein
VKLSGCSQAPELPLDDFYINKSDNLNPRYTFDSFVVGSFNQLAFTAAQAALERPGITYNPSFVYGDTGRGKTHLIQAIGNQYKKLYPNRKVYYLTSDRFGNEYTDSLQSGTANRFKEKYRQYDLLIIDDVQFFSKKINSRKNCSICSIICTTTTNRLSFPLTGLLSQSRYR